MTYITQNTFNGVLRLEIEGTLKISLLQPLLQDHPYPVIFATVTGSHAFGCASDFSDYDVHGVHLLPTVQILGLNQGQDTVERKMVYENEIDLATHDLKKFILLLLKGNGNVLEDLYSPLIIATSSIHEELKEIGKGCLTKMSAAHYKGMAYNQQRRMLSNEVKKYVHLYRCLLMGTHLMRTGELVMDIPALARMYDCPQVTKLIEYKHAGYIGLSEAETAEYSQSITTLTEQLEQARDAGMLPEKPSHETRQALDDLLVRVRLEGR